MGLLQTNLPAKSYVGCPYAELWVPKINIFIDTL